MSGMLLDAGWRGWVFCVVTRRKGQVGGRRVRYEVRPR
jgi:hypothetical protein